MQWYEQLDHTADLAFRIYGRDLPELFAHAAQALFSHLTTLEAIQPSQQEQVCVQATDCETLLVDWLNELLYLHETKGRLYCRFEITHLSDSRLEATIHGQDGARVETIVKAATYHDLAIEKTDAGYVATVVFDV